MQRGGARPGTDALCVGVARCEDARQSPTDGVRGGQSMQLIAVEDFAGAAGATVWWSLSQTTLAELEPAWVAAGLPAALLPPPPTP